MSALDTKKLEFNVSVWVPCYSSALRIGQRIQIYSHEGIGNEFLEVLDLDEGKAEIVKRKISTQLVLSTRHGGGPDLFWDMIIFSILGGILLSVLLLVIAGIVHALWTGNPNWP